MNRDFQYDVFLSHNQADKPRVRRWAERMRQDGLKVWFDEWGLPVAASRQSAAFSNEKLAEADEDGGALPRRRYAEKIEDGLEHLRVLACPAVASGRRRMLCMSANAFGSDWAQLACRAVASARRRKIVFEGERFDAVSVQNWRKRVLGGEVGRTG